MRWARCWVAEKGIPGSVLCCGGVLLAVDVGAVTCCTRLLLRSAEYASGCSDLWHKSAGSIHKTAAHDHASPCSACQFTIPCRRLLLRVLNLFLINTLAHVRHEHSFPHSLD